MSTVACSFTEVQTCLLSLAHLRKCKHVYCRLLIYGSANMSTVAICPTKSATRSTDDMYSTIPSAFSLTLYRSAHKIHHCEGIRRLHQAQFFSAAQRLTDVTKSSFALLFSAKMIPLCNFTSYSRDRGAVRGSSIQSHHLPQLGSVHTFHTCQDDNQVQYIPDPHQWRCTHNLQFVH